MKQTEKTCAGAAAATAAPIDRRLLAEAVEREYEERNPAYKAIAERERRLSPAQRARLIAEASAKSDEPSPPPVEASHGKPFKPCPHCGSVEPQDHYDCTVCGGLLVAWACRQCEAFNAADEWPNCQTCNADQEVLREQEEEEEAV